MASHDHCLGKQLPQRLVAVILFGSVAGRETTAHSDDLRVARETLLTGPFARHGGRPRAGTGGDAGESVVDVRRVAELCERRGPP